MVMHNDTRSRRPAVILLTCKLSPAQRVAHAHTEILRHFSSDQVEVVDGFVSDDMEVDQIFDQKKARFWSKRILSRGEIATYATHRLAWQKLLDDGHDVVLILEDDFRLEDPDLVRKALNEAPSLLADGRHMIKLYDYPRDRSPDIGIRIQVGAIPLVKWQRTRAGLVGYILSREGAKRMLERPKIFRVVDEDIKFFWELGIDIWSIPGNPITEIANNLGGSLLEDERQKNRRRSLSRSLKGMLLSVHRDALTRFHYMRLCRQHRSGGRTSADFRPAPGRQAAPKR